MAMAGFISSLNVFLLATLLEKDGIFDSTWAFGLWQGGTLGYVIVMAAAGWCESLRPDFTVVPGLLREWFYVLRLICGCSMMSASADWLIRATRPRQRPVIRVCPKSLLAEDFVAHFIGNRAVSTKCGTKCATKSANSREELVT
jgi:hypothetical protein